MFLIIIIIFSHQIVCIYLLFKSDKNGKKNIIHKLQILLIIPGDFLRLVKHTFLYKKVVLLLFVVISILSLTTRKFYGNH